MVCDWRDFPQARACESARLPARATSRSVRVATGLQVDRQGVSPCGQHHFYRTASGLHARRAAIRCFDRSGTLTKVVPLFAPHQ